MNGFFCVEDSLSRAAFLRIAHASHQECYLTELQAEFGGNSKIEKQLSKYNQLARHYSVFIITDLDSWQCAPTLRAGWLQRAGIENFNPNLKFNVAVSEIESWITADDVNLSTFLGMRPEHLNLDLVANGMKERLLVAVANHANRNAREEMLPAKGSKTKTGLGYNSFLEKFVMESWDMEYAATRNDSLSRAIRRIASAV